MCASALLSRLAKVVLRLASLTEGKSLVQEKTESPLSRIEQYVDICIIVKQTPHCTAFYYFCFEFMREEGATLE